MMSYQDFFTGTEVKQCGRGSKLKSLGARVLDCDSGVTAPKLIAVMTALHAWGWDKWDKHKDNPSATFAIRLQTIRTLREQTKAELARLGADANAIDKAAQSYERHKRAGSKKGLQSLGKGYHFERKQFDAMKKAGGGGKDERFTPRGGSFVSATSAAHST